MSDKAERTREDIRVGATIRAFRNSRGLSAAELGDLIGKSEELVYAIERGTRHAPLQTCQDIADALRVPKEAIKVGQAVTAA